MTSEYPVPLARRSSLHRASLAFYIIDDFTNMPVKVGRIFVHIPNVPAPVRKDDGYYVFIDLEEGEYTVHFFSDIYCQMTLEKVRVRYDQTCPVLTVRMMPGISYHLPRNAARVEGMAPPNSLIWAAFQTNDGRLKLLYDYNGGNIIRIFAGEDKSLEGRSFWIQEKEFFKIVQTLDSNERAYLLDHELKNKYARNTSRLIPVSWTQSDDHGRFFFSFYGIDGNGIHCKIGIQGSQQERCTLTLYAGKTEKAVL